MKIGRYSVSQIRKAIVGGAGAAALLGVSFLEEFTAFLPESATNPITTGIGVVTALGVFLTKNAPIIDSADDL